VRAGGQASKCNFERARIIGPVALINSLTAHDGTIKRDWVNGATLEQRTSRQCASPSFAYAMHRTALGLSLIRYKSASVRALSMAPAVLVAGDDDETKHRVARQTQAARTRRRGGEVKKSVAALGAATEGVTGAADGGVVRATGRRGRG